MSDYDDTPVRQNPDQLPVLEAQIGEVEEAGGDYVSISGSPDSVARFLRLLINWNDELERTGDG